MKNLARENSKVERDGESSDEAVVYGDDAAD